MTSLLDLPEELLGKILSEIPEYLPLRLLNRRLERHLFQRLVKDFFSHRHFAIDQLTALHAVAHSHLSQYLKAITIEIPISYDNNGIRCTVAGNQIDHAVLAESLSQLDLNTVGIARIERQHEQHHVCLSDIASTFSDYVSLILVALASSRARTLEFDLPEQMICKQWTDSNRNLFLQRLTTLTFHYEKYIPEHVEEDLADLDLLYVRQWPFKQFLSQLTDLKCLCLSFGGLSDHLTSPLISWLGDTRQTLTPAAVFPLNVLEIHDAFVAISSLADACCRFKLEVLRIQGVDLLGQSDPNVWASLLRRLSQSKNSSSLREVVISHVLHDYHPIVFLTREDGKNAQQARVQFLAQGSQETIYEWLSTQNPQKKVWSPYDQDM